MSVNSIRIIRKHEAMKCSGLSNTTLFELSRKGLFPPVINLGGARAVGYLEHEVQAVLAARAVGKSDEDIRQLVASLVEQRTSIADAFMQLVA